MTLKKNQSLLDFEYLNPPNCTEKNNCFLKLFLCSFNFGQFLLNQPKCELWVPLSAPPGSAKVSLKIKVAGWNIVGLKRVFCFMSFVGHMMQTFSNKLEMLVT